MSTPESLPRVSEPMRGAAMDLVYAAIDMHPTANESIDHCAVCKAVTAVLKVLEDDQRQHGPPIDVTDPSFTGEAAR